jgi:two-component system sensor histidine kinase YesM
MTQEQLAQIRALLDAEDGGAVVAESGYGINNVNQRIKLYYGQEYGLAIESEYLHGTRVSLVIPLQRAPAFRAPLVLGAH